MTRYACSPASGLAWSTDLLTAAASFLCARGWWEPDEGDPDDDHFLAELALTLAAHPDAKNGSDLADWWELERQEAWERSLPVLECVCGARYKEDDYGQRYTELDGQLGQHLVDGTHCPECGQVLGDEVQLELTACSSC